MPVQLAIPEPLAQLMVARAKAEGITLDEFAMRVLARGVDVRSMPQAKRDLSFMGRMSAEDAHAIEAAHELMDQHGMLGGAVPDANHP